MYANHFGLRGEPFSLTPDPTFLYMSPDHAEALAALKIGLEERRGLIVVIGEVGTGKTTILHTLLRDLGAGIHTAFITNTTLSFDEMLRQALADLGIHTKAKGKLALLDALNAFLRRCAAEGKTAALVIDEAQNLTEDAFENLRLLSNYETYTEKLLQIVLVGQPELEAKLRQPSLRQVAERVAVRCNINPLGRRESLRYIEHRLHCAGGSSALFTPWALRLVLLYSRGIPRRINILCHNAMLFAYGRDLRRVTVPVVREAVRAKLGRGLATLGRRVRRAVRSSPVVGAAPSLSGGWWMIVASSLASVGIILALGWSSRSDGARPVVKPAAELNMSAAAPSASGLVGEGPVEASLVAAPTDGLDEPAAAAPPSALGAEPTRERDAAEQPDAPAGENLALAAAAREGSPAPEPEAVRILEVRIPAGKTLFALAREYYAEDGRAVLSRIKAANPQIVDVNHILAGDTVRLPNPTIHRHE